MAAKEQQARPLKTNNKIRSLRVNFEEFLYLFRKIPFRYTNTWTDMMSVKKVAAELPKEFTPLDKSLDAKIKSHFDRTANLNLRLVIRRILQTKTF